MCVRACVSYPTVFALVKDLRWQGVPSCRPRLLGNVLPHPLPVVLVGGDVTLLEVDLIGGQEAHHVLLLLLDLRARRGGTERKPSVRHALTSAFCGSIRLHPPNRPAQQTAISLLKKIRTLCACSEKRHH